MMTLIKMSMLALAIGVIVFPMPSLASTDRINTSTFSNINILRKKDDSSEKHIFRKINFWNHIKEDGNWDGLQRVVSAYDIPDAKLMAACENSVCPLRFTLVKKIVDWHQQHSTGIEIVKLDELGLRFGDIASFSIELTIHQEHSYIPSPEQLKAKYQQYLKNTEQMNWSEFDHGKVNIMFVFYEKNDVDALDAKLMASVEIDAKYNLTSDQNGRLKINIPASLMFFYSEKNYQKTPYLQSEFSSKLIKGLTITTETTSRSVLRGKMPLWSDAIPESYKEVDVSFHELRIHTK